MKLEIKTFSMVIPANRSFSEFGWKTEASIVISTDAVREIERLAIEKVKEKYPNAINPKLCGVSLTRRASEDYLNANCEVNIGEGDYITRNVYLELPPMEWMEWMV